MTTRVYTTEEQQWIYDNIFGAGAFSHCPWYGRSTAYDDGMGSDTINAWPVTLTTVDPDDPDNAAERASHSLSVETIIDAAQQIADGKHTLRDVHVSKAAELISDPEDADLDAFDADVILQVACFGEVRYG